MWQGQLTRLISLPRAQQFAALKSLRRTRNNHQLEEWNTAFGSASVYEAWTQLPLMQGLYSRNQAILREVLTGRKHWHIVEIGGGNGALWRHFFRPHDQGTLTLIDPQPEVHATVATCLPQGIDFHSLIAPVEEVEIPEADVLICSLTLHHVAGLNAAQRSMFGLRGLGKQEILQQCVRAIRKRRGVGILNEADIYNEVDLAPGDQVLIEHFIDVYVRRAAMAVATALEHTEADQSLKQRWEIILQHWCLDQVDKALVPREERDVYELDMPQWLRLLELVGAQVRNYQYTDEWNLFQQYVFDSM
jgi:hypothetical protein